MPRTLPLSICLLAALLVSGCARQAPGPVDPPAAGEKKIADLQLVAGQEPSTVDHQEVVARAGAVTRRLLAG